MTSASSSEFDVLVIGGGPSGFGAAVAAARADARTALIERHPLLGGMGTAALVNNFCPAHLDGQRLIIGGVFGDLRRRLIDRKAIFSAPDDATYMMEMFNPEVYADLMAEMCREAGVELLLGTSITDIKATDAGTLVTLDNGTLLCKTLVDATGDAVFAARLGLDYTFGRASDHAVMPLSLCYEIGPIDLQKMDAGMTHCNLRVHPLVGETSFSISEDPQTRAWVAEAKSRGELSIPRDGIATIQNYPGRSDHATVNFTRVFCKDPTDPELLRAARAEGERQMEEGVRFFRKYLPGFEQVEVIRSALQIGVRESRQITGLHRLTGEEARSCTQFADVIAQCCYSIDIHEPGKESTTMIPFKPGTHFDIPWRSLIPATGPGNLVIAGRCISADQEAMSSFRVAPSAMAIGEAAGVTAALAAERNCPVAEVGHAPVQERLRKNGAILN
jgi:glycine/D-amino acid oxidase-like deaminating enzyme